MLADQLIKIYCANVLGSVLKISVFPSIGYNRIKLFGKWLFQFDNWLKNISFDQRS